MVQYVTLEEIRARRRRPPLSQMSIAEKAACIAALLAKSRTLLEEQSRMLEIIRALDRKRRGSDAADHD